MNNSFEAWCNAIATAVPSHECQQLFLDTLPDWLHNPALVARLQRMARGSGVERRYTVLHPAVGPPGGGAFYEYGRFPGTAARMLAYRQHALPLALNAVRGLKTACPSPATITHLIVTSCTGFYAPGLDVELVQALGLPPGVRRILIGFMGCFAGITGLRTARDIVLADPEARVLMVNLELCSLHFQESTSLDRLVSFMLFADGCAASIISARPGGLRLDDFRTSLSLADRERMAWQIGDQGFLMTLDPDVPVRIREFIQRHPDCLGHPAGEPRPGLWAIHPGGRAILDAVQDAFGLTAEQVAPSRRVLAQFGNMSSATVMFVLRDLMETATAGAGQPGCAIAFGPGLTLEGMQFTLCRATPDCDVTAASNPVNEADLARRARGHVRSADLADAHAPYP